MIDHIGNLSRSLAEIADGRLSTRRGAQWGDTGAMSDVLAAIERTRVNPQAQSHQEQESLTSIVGRFRETQQLSNYRQTKYLCIAVAQDFAGWCILEEPDLLARLLIRPRLGLHRQRLRLYFCLLQSYWAFRRDDEDTSAAATAGWLTLRHWLETQRAFLDQAVKEKPRWFGVLCAHAEFLRGEPLERYGKDLLEGPNECFDQAAAVLGVPPDSWLRSEVIVALMRAAALLDDEGFNSRIGLLVDKSKSGAGTKIPPIISKRCLAILVSRYAACSNRREHIPLRDAAVAFIGDPWMDRTNWEISVQDETGKPNHDARKMVNGWLQIRLIKDFFGLLTEDLSADNRRLKYWLRFESAIKAMWFGLGADCLRDARTEYSAFRDRARGRILALTGATPAANNVFLMHLGDYLIVEFGIIDNACFLFRYEEVPPPVKNRLTSKDEHGAVDIADLKSNRYKARLRHHGNWESTFDSLLCPLLGIRPDQPRIATTSSAALPGSQPGTAIEAHIQQVQRPSSRGA